MANSIVLRAQLRDAIDEEIATRTAVHQKSIARLKIGRANVMAAAAAAPPQAAPLVMLALGDSWFDYPLTGNGLPFNNTDIIAQLGTMGRVNPVILNMSHHGDATTDELALPKQQRMIEALQDPDNWMSAGKPDAILFSGGGNNIAGDQFCIFLDVAAPGSTGIAGARFDAALDMVQASYQDLFVFRDRYARGVPIFGHCYDFPIPNGVHPICAGPWLKPSLDYSGWTDLEQGTAICRQVLTKFRTMLLGLAGNPGNNFILVDTQGLLTDAAWANELHPYPAGFKAIAGRFVDALGRRFVGGI
jgi:hypothetical protein